MKICNAFKAFRDFHQMKRFLLNSERNKTVLNNIFIFFCKRFRVEITFRDLYPLVSGHERYEDQLGPSFDFLVI